jgi:acetoin utilization protein AcuB
MPATEAQHVMAENNIRHLPVVGDGKRLVGLITRERLSLKPDTLGSLDVWEISRYLTNLTARQLMLKERDVVTIAPDRTIERAAALMTEKKIGCLPVVEKNNVVVGIVTQIDVLDSFQEMLGLPVEGIRVTVRMPDRPGEFSRLTKVVGDNNWGVMGIGSFPARRHPGFYDVVLKIRSASVDEVQSALEQLEDQVIVDIRTVA